MKEFFNKHPWLKNYGFYVGIASALFVAIDLDPMSITSWPALLEALKIFISNPAAIAAFIGILTTARNNPSLGTGLRDKYE